MPCKRDKQHANIVRTNAEQKNGHEKEFKNNVWLYGGIPRVYEIESRIFAILKVHEDRIAGKGFTSMLHYNLVHKLIPMPQAMKIPDARAAVDKEWKKLETIPSMAIWEKSRAKKKLFWKHKEINIRVHFASLMDICHLKNAELETQIVEV